MEKGKRLVDPRGITIGKYHVKDRRVRHPQICYFRAKDYYELKAIKKK